MFSHSSLFSRSIPVYTISSEHYPSLIMRYLYIISRLGNSTTYKIVIWCINIPFYRNFVSVR